jgi:hypothetical protein
MKPHRTGADTGWILFSVFVFAAMSPMAGAAELRAARVTKIINDVKLLPGQAAARPATVDEELGAGTAVRTGVDSRTELTFADLTITRLGANTIFSVDEGARKIELGGGAVLVQVPRGGAEAKVATAAVTAAITGGTALFESNKGLPTKLLMLEGIGRFYPNGHPEQAEVVHGGEMVMRTVDGKITKPTKFNAALVYKTSKLITSFPTLPNADLIMAVIEEQQAELAEGPSSPGSSNPIDQIDQATVASASSPVAALSKFGPLSTITTPNPYMINSGTKINTDPTITTSGVTDSGKIYRGAAQDGDPAIYLFGSTSSFDTNSGFDEQLKQAPNLPIAAFRFTNLQLIGNPTLTIPGGAATKLALISEGSITSAAPGGTLNFSGLDTVLLATVNGSITLTPDITFSSLPSLIFHARGSTANITIASPITGVGVVQFDAENSVQINAAENVTTFLVFANVDFLDGTGHVVAQNIHISTGNSINFTTSDFAVGPGATPNVLLSSGGPENLDIRTDHTVFSQAASLEVHGSTITFTADAGGTTLLFNNSTPVSFFAGSGGIQAAQTTFQGNSMEFLCDGGIMARSIIGGDSVQSNVGDIGTSGDLIANFISAGGNVSSGGDLTAFSSVNAGLLGSINVTNTLLSPFATAGGNITAGHIEVQQVNPPGGTSTTTLTAGAVGITPFVGPSGSALQHTFNVMTVVSPNGIDFNGSHFNTARDGGLLTINAQTQNFSAAGINGANFDGADALPVPGATPGNGGTLTVNTSGALSVSSSNIDATTGIIDTNAPQPLGAGGTVNLTSSNGTVTVNNSRIQVSSSDPNGTANRRSSARGGTIALQSGAATGVAINIANTAQLLSLLENAAPGPGGIVTITATSVTGNSQINVSGQIEADKGAIDVRHMSDGGVINVNNANMAADIIKIAALGSNGTLTIGGGILNANTVLKLYAPGSNGSIIFVADCSIGGGSATILAANAVTINNGVMVNVIGHKADVFVNFSGGIPNANYTNFGGNNSTNGTFIGLGATNPQQLANAPLLGPPGGP